MTKAAPLPLAGKTVAVLFPAWHSCGTYRVVLGQLAAYRALGASVVALAVSLDPGFTPQRRWLWRGFLKNAPELADEELSLAGVSLRALASPAFLRHALWPYLHGDQAIIRRDFAARAVIPAQVSEQNFALVHCNHFFLMPAARRIAGEAPIVLDTHDLQARQFALMNERMRWLSPRVSHEAMLAQELLEMSGAALLIHLNAAEKQEFETLLPLRRHALLYPAVPAPTMGAGGDAIVLIASNNSANVDSVEWFLRDVAPLAREARVTIFGNVDVGLKAKAPDLYARHRDSFAGRVDSPAAAYEGASLVLLPTVSGHGLSIKTVEAMASGLPVIATPLALRGMSAEAKSLPGLTLAASAKDFAAALVAAAAARRPLGIEERRASALRAYYEAHFSKEAYQANLVALLAPLL